MSSSQQDQNKSSHTSYEAGLPAKEIDANCVLLAFLLVVTVAGNSLILAAYLRNARLRTVSNKFVVSLALSDLLVGAISVPVWMYMSLSQWKVTEEVAKLFAVIDMLSATASILHLTSISIERYIAISRPFFYNTLPYHAYHSIIAAIWIASTVLAILKPFIHAVFLYYELLLLLILFFGSLAVITVMNIGIYKIAKRLIHSTPACNGSDNEQLEMQNNVRRERKIAATLAIITGIFFVTWLPHVAVAIIFNFCESPCNLSRSGLDRLGFFVKWMQFVNSAINPFVFAFRDVEMRETFSRILASLGKSLRLCGKTRVHPVRRDNEHLVSVL